MRHLSRLSSPALLARTGELVRRARDAEAELLEHLAEVEMRKLYLERGHPSMFVYCVEELRFSESAAYRRIRAARLGREFPRILRAIRSGELHLTAVAMIAPRVTAENCSEWVARARHCSRAEIQELLAECEPRPEQRDTIRRVPDRTSPVAQPPAASPPAAVTPALAPPPNPPARSEPMGAQRYRVSFTADATLHAELRELRALMRHQVPDGDVGAILARAVSALLAQIKAARFGDVERPRARTPVTAPTRHIPAYIRRVVFRRDEGRCAYVSPEGRRCGAREFLEFHHLVPWAEGRMHTVEGISLRCRAHNQYAERERDPGP